MTSIKMLLLILLQAADTRMLVNEGTVDQEITVNNSGSNITAKQISVNVQTVERCYKEKIDREMGNIVDKVEDFYRDW